MKKTITCIILAFFAITLFAQTEYDSMLFDNSLLLKNGIYTSLKEVRSNTPKFPNCELEIGAIQDKINVDNLFYINSNNTRLKFEANLYATVINGRLFIFYKSQLNPIFLKAAISTFMIKEWVSVPANDADRLLCIFDGLIDGPESFFTIDQQLECAFMRLVLGARLK